MKNEPDEDNSEEENHEIINGDGEQAAGDVAELDESVFYAGHWEDVPEEDYCGVVYGDVEQAGAGTPERHRDNDPNATMASRDLEVTFYGNSSIQSPTPF